MTGIDEQFKAHQAGRPELPRPFDPASPEGVAFHLALSAWIARGQSLAERVNLRDRQRAGSVRARRARAAAAEADE